VTKVFAFGLALFSGAFLLAMVLSVCLIFAGPGGFSASHPIEYLALGVLLVVPLFGLNAAFKALTSPRSLMMEHPNANRVGHVLLGLGLLGLYTRITAPTPSGALEAIQIASVCCLIAGSVLLWRFRHHA
jgi:hypothetical protein